MRPISFVYYKSIRNLGLNILYFQKIDILLLFPKLIQTSLRMTCLKIIRNTFKPTFRIATILLQICHV
jgi:hypothetical protein